MYAYGLMFDIVCKDCSDKPCPRRSWLEKNACPKIIAKNEELGRRCATCMHLVAGQYCGEKARGKKIDAGTDLSRFLVGDIYRHCCEEWTNTYEEYGED